MKMKKLWILGLLCFVQLSLLNGCDVPRAYQIANTVSPQDEDVDVRFRTTYYLRVFDLCRIDEDGKYGKYDRGTAKFVHRTSGPYRVMKDSLYRFRMTGQANAFSNDVRFESGTLYDYQVDPFGMSIEFDEKRKRFQSPRCTKGVTHGDDADCRSSQYTDRETPATDVTPCPDGGAKDTKFYLLGPEGIKELKLSERLVMAMSTNAKPLISALQRIGGIKAQAEAESVGQYRVKLNQARVAVALEKLIAEKRKIEKAGIHDLPSPEALEAVMLNLFKGEAEAR